MGVVVSRAPLLKLLEITTGLNPACEDFLFHLQGIDEFLKNFEFGFCDSRLFQAYRTLYSVLYQDLLN